MKIPTIFKNIFWEYNLDNIDVRKHSSFVICRILEKGDISSLKWLFSVFSQNQIKDVLGESKNISNKTSNFWNIVFKYA